MASFFKVGEWLLECREYGEIAPEALKESSAVGVPRFPTMAFHRNGLFFQYKTRPVLQLDCMALLQSAQHANIPNHLQHLVHNDRFPTVPYDWTFEPHVPFAQDASVAIDYARLADQSQPILWYAETVLYEDELFDCGSMRVLAKVRVMPFGWFALLTHSVDYQGPCLQGAVVRREKQYRFFHAFADDAIACELRIDNITISRGRIRLTGSTT
jgi:hypothetical protein